MTEATENNGTESDESSGATVANIQRTESGYFDHMESLRNRIPVGDYLVEQETGRLALVAMAVVSVVFLVLFPLTMFRQFSFVVVAVFMVVFAAAAQVFYNRVMLPNERPEEWRD